MNNTSLCDVSEISDDSEWFRSLSFNPYYKLNGIYMRMNSSIDEIDNEKNNSVSVTFDNERNVRRMSSMSTRRESSVLKRQSTGTEIITQNSTRKSVVRKSELFRNDSKKSCKTPQTTDKPPKMIKKQSTVSLKNYRKSDNEPNLDLLHAKKEL